MAVFATYLGRSEGKYRFLLECDRLRLLLQKTFMNLMNRFLISKRRKRPSSKERYCFSSTVSVTLYSVCPNVRAKHIQFFWMQETVSRVCSKYMRNGLKPKTFKHIFFLQCPLFRINDLRARLINYRSISTDIVVRFPPKWMGFSRTDTHRFGT